VLFDESPQGTIAQVAEGLFYQFLVDRAWTCLRPNWRTWRYEAQPAATDDYIQAVQIKTFQDTYQWQLYWAKTYGWYFQTTHWWSVRRPPSLEALRAWTHQRNDAHVLYNVGWVNPPKPLPVSLQPSMEKLLAESLAPQVWPGPVFRARWPHPEALRALKALCPSLVVANLRDLSRFEARYESKLNDWETRQRQGYPMGGYYDPTSQAWIASGDPLSLEPDGQFRPDWFDFSNSWEFPVWIRRDHRQEYNTLYRPGIDFLRQQTQQYAAAYYVNLPISFGGKKKFRADGPMLEWPDLRQLLAATHWVLDQLAEGATVLFHCRGGRHRTGMVALLLEKLHLAASGQDSEAATHRLKQHYACHVIGLDGHVTGFRSANLGAVNAVLQDAESWGALLNQWQQLLRRAPASARLALS
jgi:hypothetical protein